MAETTQTAPAAHTRYLSSRAEATLHGKTEKHKVSCSGFPPNTSPMQHSCSHYIRICNQRVNKRKESRTHEQPLIAENRGGTDHGRNDPSRTRRTHEVPFIAGCSHTYTWKNTRFRALAFSPNQPSRDIHAAITLRSATRSPTQ